jgi:hypothetical protein
MLFELLPDVNWECPRVLSGLAKTQLHSEHPQAAKVLFSSQTKSLAMIEYSARNCMVNTEQTVETARGILV